jgi:outer membrane receptor protein involved in Fe transport
MTQRCLRVLARVLLVLAAAATTAGVSALSAQSTGKIEGHIRDAASQQPIARASVVIPGTSYSATADARGYYFIENVPAGTYSLRTLYPGYKAHEMAGLRVQAGQTMTQDFTLEAAPVQLAEITVTAAKNALVPKDAVTTKQTINGDAVQKLPVDRIAQALALQPGVVQVSVCGTNQPCAPTISVRGGRIDQNATYIDGVPVQNGIHTGASGVTGAPVLTVATNGLEEASITSGASSAAFGNAQAGIINISTKSGGTTLNGNIGYETGLAGLAYYGQGLNTFRASLGGPIGKHLTFYLSGNVEGNNSSNGGNHGWLFPSYSRVSIDTTYTVPFAPKAGTATVVDSNQIPVYNYAVTQGGCNLPADSGGYLGAHNTAMAANYGATCHANQGYSSPSTNYFTTDKLTYSFGQGSRLSLSYLFSGNQNRGVLADGTNTGNVTGSNVATLNWNQTLIKQANHQLTLDAYVSRQWNNQITAPLTAASEQATRGSPGGFILHKFAFIYNETNYPVDSLLIFNVLTVAANHRIGITDPKNTTQYNGIPGYANQSSNGQAPDGVGYSAGGGGGDNNTLAYNHENRWVGIANLDFQADRYNRLKVGGQYTAYDILNYSASTLGTGIWPFTYENGHLTAGGKPVAYNAYAEDRVDLGDVVLVAGVRYDYYWTKAWRWNEYPEISSRPGFTPDSLFCPAGATPSATAKCAMIQDPSHNYVSPHMQVSFPVTDQTNFRLSYAQNVQAPDFGLSYQNSTCDINIGCANSRSRWGQDLDFGKTITFEFGARHAFSDDMVLDVAVYNNDIVANPSFGYEHPIDPVSGQASIVYLVTNKDFGNTRGIDVRLDRRIGSYFNGSLTYSFQDSKNTGTDPFSYLGFFEPISGFVGDPPTAALTTALSRPHSLTALFNFNLPADWEKGSILGTILKRTGFNVVGRIASGQAYTRCDPADPGSIGVLGGNPCGTLGAVSNFNASRLPMQKQFDMRVTKDFRIGKYDVTGYIDARNVLNLQNITSVYAQTGSTSSGLVTAQRWSTDSSTFVSYGRATSEYNAATGNVTLPSSIAACSKVISGTSSYAAACYYMIRSEQRFGNGDGVYTPAEQRAASDSKNQFANSVWARNSGARTIRFGLDVNF